MRHCEQSEAIFSAVTHYHHSILIRLLHRNIPRNDSDN